jgi:hypothetical protein
MAVIRDATRFDAPQQETRHDGADREVAVRDVPERRRFELENTLGKFLELHGIGLMRPQFRQQRGVGPTN